VTHGLYRLGRFAARRPWAVIGAWLAVAVLVIAASGAHGRDLEDTFDVPGLDSQQARELLTAAGSDRAGLTAHVVVTPRDESATFFDSAAARAALARLRDGAAALPAVLSASDDALSPDGRVAVITLRYPVVEELSPKDLEDLKELVGEARTGSPLRIEAGGDLFFSFEEPEAGVGEAVGVIAAALILLVAFGSLIAMGLPIGTALFGLALGVTSLSLIAHLVDIPTWAPQLAVMIGLGTGIDYALFLVTRHREHLAQGMSVEEAAGRAVATAGQAVIFAGGTVVIAILGLSVAGIPFVTAAAVAISVVVLTVVVASVTLAPALLGLAGPRINRLGLGRADRGASGSRWRRWGEHVSAHSVAYAVGATILLLALAAPALALRLDAPDEGDLPSTRTERRAYDLIADAFGPGRNGPLVVAVDIAKDPSVLEPLRAAIAADHGVAAVTPPETNRQVGVATLLAYPTTAPQDDITPATIHRLRERVFPAVLHGSPARAHVGGHTATWTDIGDRLGDRLPLFLSAVILLSFLLLTVMFRSVVVPLTAAVMNLLSIGVAYGVLVMVFQWGWGGGLIGLESTFSVEPFIPIFMFAILFGLSMDYEVFLLSRVRERYLLTRDNHYAVIDGLAGSARVITSAALIMISVFLGFVLGDDPYIKMFGLGLATAIFVDATIVRMILVPATMKLLGDTNWWLPAWLDRLLPTIDVGAQAPPPGPEREADLVPEPIKAVAAPGGAHPR
jgi:putative drug exporter of the RND superfamily